MVTKTIPAVYEQGVFRPLEPVDLEEGHIVHVPVPVEESLTDISEGARQEHIRELRTVIAERLEHPRRSPEDEAWWEEFRVFLRENRLTFPERDLGLGDE